MTSVSDLYQEILLDHNSKPRNFRKPEGATHSVDGHNPLCGDKITIYLTVADGVITDAGFQGSGCAISKASASMLTQGVKGQSAARALEIFDAFHRMMTEPDAELDYDTLGDLESLAGVVEFPTRIKCAILAWHAMRSALEGQGETVTSE
jgi:nitrogen fixation NifU-like protein|tara:strand:- start:143 stop:592 length:450 start_codon:yes stop_codon:yes gene_type:complete